MFTSVRPKLYPDIASIDLRETSLWSSGFGRGGEG